MKRKVLAILFFVSGCSLKPASKTILDRYVGREGYFKVYPHIMTTNLVKSTKSYQPCERSKITNVQSYGSNWYVTIQQGDSEYIVENPQSDSDNIERIEANFVKDLKLPLTKIKFKDGTFTIKEMVCRGTVYTGMKKEHFLISRRLPDDINRTVSTFGVSEQWVYRGSSKASYYYFKDDILSSWQD